VTAGPRTFHDFCFLDVMTEDGARAREFFGTLPGWTFGEMAGVPGGALILVDGRTAGALMDMPKAGFPPGSPPAIGVMVASRSRSSSGRADRPAPAA
jgi:predicted enzyme related to lactoylglutathione lyase